MMTGNSTRAFWILAALTVKGFTFNVSADAKPLQVYILAGQPRHPLCKLP